MPVPTDRTIAGKSRLLKKLATGASIAASAKAALVARSTYYEWRESDPDFARLADEAIDTGTDFLEDSALKQAKDGNTTLMVLLLKSRRADKYKDRTEQQHTGPNGAPFEVVITRVNRQAS